MICVLGLDKNGSCVNCDNHIQARTALLSPGIRNTCIFNLKDNSVFFQIEFVKYDSLFPRQILNYVLGVLFTFYAYYSAA